MEFLFFKKKMTRFFMVEAGTGGHFATGSCFAAGSCFAWESFGGVVRFTTMRHCWQTTGETRGGGGFTSMI